MKLKLKISSDLTFFLITDEELSEFYNIKYVNCSQVEGGRKDLGVSLVEQKADFFCSVILFGHVFIDVCTYMMEKTPFNSTSDLSII